MASERTLAARGPFSLAEASRFLCGFTPASGACNVDGERVRIAFRLDGSFAPVGAALTQTRETEGVQARLFGDGDADAIARQAARILSLDHDARGYAAVGARDAVVARAQAALPGLRPVVFASPYEAGAWGILAQRTPMSRAAALKRALAEAHGDTLTVDGARLAIFPSPAQLLAVAKFSGVADEKLARLHALADAARAGVLDADRLRALPRDAAIAELSSLRGVGPWTAEHILVRGCGTADVLPVAEPRVDAAVQLAYDLAAAPSPSEIALIAEAWRPFRTWVTVALVVQLARAGRFNGAARTRSRTSSSAPRRRAPRTGRPPAR